MPTKKASQKKSAASKKGSKKAVAPKAKKAEATTFAAAEALKGNCLGLQEAGAIVRSAVVAVGGISVGSYSLEKRLEQMGVITPNQCTQVTGRILGDVRSFPCDINDAAAACTPTTVARALRDQVKDNAAQ